MSSSGDESPRRLDVTGYFNPVDCRSLGVIRTTLAPLPSGTGLIVVCNRFQAREISAWARKFRHDILLATDLEGQVTLTIRKGGLSR